MAVRTETANARSVKMKVNGKSKSSRVNATKFALRPRTMNAHKRTTPEKSKVYVSSNGILKIEECLPRRTNRAMWNACITTQNRIY